MTKPWQFLFWLVVASALALSTQAADRITATVTVTNYPVSGDFLTVNGSARQWSNVTASTSIATNALQAAHGTNLYLHIITNGLTGPIYVTQTSPTNISLLGNVGQAMTVTASGAWASIGFTTQAVAVAKDVRVPFSVEAATNATNIASQLVSDLSTHSTNAFASGSIALSNYAGIRLPNAFFHSNHFLGSNVFTGSNTLIGPTLVSRATVTNLYAHGGAITNAGGNVFAGSSTIGTVTITNGTIVSGTVSNATIYIPTNTMADVDTYTNGFMLVAKTNGVVVPTNRVSYIQVDTLSGLSSTIGLNGSGGHPLYFDNAPFSGIKHDTFTSPETNAWALVSSNLLGILVTPSRTIVSNANFPNKILFTNSTSLGSDPASGVEVAATSAEWTYRTSTASEGAGQVNRVHNRAAEVVGSGSSYSLTTSYARVDFGGTDVEFNTLPSAGTYHIIVTIDWQGGNANDLVSFKLYDATAAADISNSEITMTADGAATDHISTLNSIVTVTGANRIQLFGKNATGARGSVESTHTKMIYVRLH